MPFLKDQEVGVKVAALLKKGLKQKDIKDYVVNGFCKGVVQKQTGSVQYDVKIASDERVFELSNRVIVAWISAVASE